MNAEERRKEIIQALQQSENPLSAGALAAQFSVSRQIIVGDIALLRAGGSTIAATPRGYLLETKESTYGTEKAIVCMHDTMHMAEEIYTVVDMGGCMLDVTVEHTIYGEICAPLHIFSRYDADLFLSKVKESGARPLCDLTGGVHLHRLRYPEEAVFTRIEAALREKGILYREAK